MTNLLNRTLSATAICVLVAGLLTGCATTQKTSTAFPDGASHCPQPRATSSDRVICPMNYQPVCGIDGSGKAVSTYSNSCGACAEPTVAGYTDGACP